MEMPSAMADASMWTVPQQARTDNTPALWATAQHVFNQLSKEADPVLKALLGAPPINILPL